MSAYAAIAALFSLPAFAAVPISAGSPSAHSQPAGASAFAMLPLVAGDPGLPYAIFPSASERTALGEKIESDLVRRHAGRAANDATVAGAIALAGFDQNSPYTACDEAECARTIGRKLHVDTVIFGSVTRYLAMIWGSEVSIVDVRSGRVTGPYTLGYKGDYDSLSMGIGDLSASLAETLAQAP